MKKILIAALNSLLVLTLCCCDKNDKPIPDITDVKSAAMVLKWNAAGIRAVGTVPGVSPMSSSRMYAMINIAMSDALNNIVLKYQPYALKNVLVNNADADAAVAQAAHDVIAALVPSQKNFADSLLTVSLDSVTAGSGKDDGIGLGKAAAKSIIDLRNGDGASIAQYPYPQGTLPGEYRSAPPFDAGPNAGFVALPGWGKVKPFTLLTAAQFRPAAPYQLNSAGYTADFNEVKKMGCMTCTERSTDEKQVGLFWLENVPNSWNRIAATLITANNLSAWQAARLLALVQLCAADVNIACMEAKVFYNFWRPVTAIKLGDGDDNENTVGDAAWNVLAPPTPPAPEYPSNHAMGGGAAAELIKNFFGKDDIAFSATSTSLPGVTRNFTSLSQAATETALSRIYAGYHFRNAVVKGEAAGREIGKYIFDNFLQAVR
jgi:PAP2 superfamily